MTEIRLKVYRHDPALEVEPRYSLYTLRVERTPSVLEALRRIYESHDPTLAFRNYHCGRGVCASCMVMLNGRAVKGCETLLDPARENVLEPLKGRRVIRDLVVEMEATP
jgi:succinate dehydrogenase/fumarate reductase-like Fe-S protein